MAALMQPPLKFWSAAGHTGYLNSASKVLFQYWVLSVRKVYIHFVFTSLYVWKHSPIMQFIF